MRTKSAFTILETLAVIAIISVLAAIVTPMFAAARTEARKTQTMQNMRQMGLALSMYREEYDGATTGEPSEMGMPPDLITLWVFGKMEISQTRCRPDGQNLSPFRRSFVRMWQPTIVDHRSPKWVEHISTKGDATIAVAGMCYTDLNQPFGSSFALNTGLGLYMDTHVRTIRKPGEWNKLDWWD